MAEAGARRPSIRDVAAAAGVSYQTVSRVLNDPALVRPATAERIQKVIQELGYRPSKAARSLVRRDSLTIGAVGIHGDLHGPTQMTVAIDEGARARGYASASLAVRDDSEASRTEAREHLLNLGVDGVIVVAWTEAMMDLALDFAKELPTCVVTEGDIPSGLARAHSDHVSGARQATAALRETGRRRIAHLSGPASWMEAQSRVAGWREAGGAACGPLVEAGWAPRDGYDGVDRLLAAAPDLDAIFAANDQVAIGAMRRLQEIGRTVPGDIAVVGYDDIDVGPFQAVPLATVRQPFADVGSTAVDLLFQVMGGGQAASCTLPSEFVWRESAGR
ncbi:MAG: LacI family DNA-binding transcriptional regulator [Tessaracoccus sp.]|uniref:LacI family DNA-binding transcriptional regulator n=1 Tax=Tessaracoccus sp. TaxID=1971211 RepID=UPI001EC1827D|nr:LacI family DNA-binding transcriptional regulator [Tessaracoccus sp.]MBK7820567.1 LacI family DNA-binding transcriptional regulator [Tessaracoccus sp.]